MTTTIVTSQLSPWCVGLPASSNEARIARRLRPLQKTQATIANGSDNASLLSESRALETKLRSQWILNAVQDLATSPVPGPSDTALEKICQHLVATFDIGTNSKRPCVSRYTEWMQLQTLLPLYLSPSNNHATESIAWSHRLAEEALLLLELDQALGDELVDHLSDGGMSQQHPAAALHQTLTIRLDTIASCAVHSHSTHAVNHATSLIEIPIEENRRQAYWSLAQQLIGGASHLHIPVHLNVGKVTWPRVRDHWQRIRNYLTKFTVDSITTDAAQATLSSTGTVSSQRISLATEFQLSEEAATPWSVIEIRSANDPKLSDTLSVELDHCRQEGRSMSFAVFQCPTSGSVEKTSSPTLKSWHTLVLDAIQCTVGDRALRGFIADSGELAIVLAEMDRTEATRAMRNLLEHVEEANQPAAKIVENPKLGIACGLACVDVPSKRLKIEQLIEAAWRCLTAASKQGTGSVKSIEVF